MNIRQVRKKIKSIGNVKKITRAMQLVSAVKMKKAQQVAVEGRPYREVLEEVIAKILPTVDMSSSPLLHSHEEKESEKKELVIFISANKGLCGSFNANLFRLLLKKEDWGKADFITIGRKGMSFASRSGNKIVADFSVPSPTSEVSAIFNMASKYFLEGQYNQITIAYNKFVSTLRSEPIIETLLPVSIIGSNSQVVANGGEYLFEPGKEALFNNLLENYVEEKIRGALLNSEAAEHSSRMIAMKNATDNANDVIYNLTLLRNQLRQQKITYELLDMITAKESVEAN